MASNEFHGLSGSKLATARRQLGGRGYDGMSQADGELTRAEQMHFPGTRASEFIGPVKHNEQITGYIYFAFTFMRVLNHIHDP